MSPIPPRAARCLSFARRVGILAGCLTLPLTAEVSVPGLDEDPPEGGRRDLPALKMLTKGSILRGVTFPRYDENRVLTRVLQAGQLTLRDEETIEARDLSIRDYGEDGAVTSLIRLQAATLEQQSLLRSKAPVSIDSPELLAKGQGIVYQIESGRGFLVGPVLARTQIDTRTSMNPLPKLPAAMAAAVLVASGAEGAPDSAPRRFDEQELAGLDRLAESRASAAQDAAAEAATQLETAAKASERAEEELSEFLKTAGLEKGTDPAADLVSEVPRPEGAPPLDASIECSDGAYFDPEEGLLVFLKEVAFADPEFKLTGADEVKVFFDKPKEKPTDKKKAEAPDAGQAGDESASAADTSDAEKKKDKGLLDGGKFGEPSRIVATGRIVAESKPNPEKKDEFFKVSGAQFVFDIKTNQLIVRGGRPWVISKDLQGYIEDPDGYFIIDVKTRKGSAVGTLKAFIEAPTND